MISKCVEADVDVSVRKPAASVAMPQMAAGYRGLQNRSFFMAKMNGNSLPNVFFYGGFYIGETREQILIDDPIDSMS